LLTSLAKRVAALLPEARQQELKRRHFRKEIERDSFRTDEPEWTQVEQWLKHGDWAIDVGANVGHYTKKFSDLVGAAGRVIAFEPVPATFELLAANAARFSNANVTLLNLAASEATRVISMSIPLFETGLNNYYQAAISNENTGLQALTCSIDSLDLPQRVRVLKIDAEGHDAVVLRGARSLLERDHPVVIIESVSSEVIAMMGSLGYSSERLPGSSNVIYIAQESNFKFGA
jgi:FkbM family methyltransferase